MSKAVATHPDDDRFRAGVDLEAIRKLHIKIRSVLQVAKKNRLTLSRLQDKNNLYEAWELYEAVADVEFDKLEYEDLKEAAREVSSEFHSCKGALEFDVYSIVEALLTANSQLVEKMVPRKKPPDNVV